MSGERWHVIEGRGEDILATISADVRRWNSNSSGMAGFEGVVDDYETAARLLTHNAIDTAVQEGYLSDVHRIVEDLSEEQLLAVLHSRIGTVAFAKINGLQRGTGFGYGKKARVTILEEGVGRRRGLIEEGHQIHRLGKKKPAELGEEITGTVRELISRPTLGGLLRLDGWRTTVLTGLVSTVTGNPRVRLDILAKR